MTERLHDGRCCCCILCQCDQEIAKETGVPSAACCLYTQDALDLGAGLFPFHMAWLARARRRLAEQTQEDEEDDGLEWDDHSSLND